MKSVQVIFAIVAIFATSSFVNAGDLNLTPEEQAWLEQHPVVRIGIDANYAPYSYTDLGGRFIGVAPDLLALIEKKLGIRFEPVPGLSWPEIVTGAKKRNLDVIATAVITEERKSFLDFTEIYIPTPLVIMTRREDNRVNTPDDLRNLNVALVKGYSSSQRVITEHPNAIQRLVDTPLEGLTDVATGDADAYVGVLGINVYLASTYGINNLKIASRYDLKTNGQRLAVRNDWPELASILGKALAAIPEAEKLAVMRQWLPVSNENITIQKGQAQADRISLSQSEQDFINAHPVIRVANESDWPPFDFIDKDGRPVGFSVDYIRLVADKVGLRINWVNRYSWDQLLQKGRDREVDVFPVIIRNAERENYLLFSDVYLNNTIAYYVREGVVLENINNASQLKEYRIALVRGFYNHEYFVARHPEINVVDVDSVLEGLKAVSTGDADVFIGDTAVSHYNIKKYLLRGIRQAGSVNISELKRGENLHVAVRSDWPEMLAILQKGMQAITEDELYTLRDRWLDLPQKPGLTREALIGLGMAAALLILLLITVWIWVLRRQRDRLTREVDEQTRALYESERRLSLALKAGEMVAWDYDIRNRRTIASQGWDEMLGYKDGKVRDPYKLWVRHIHPDDRENVLASRRLYNEEKSDRYEVEYRVITLNGETRWQLVHGMTVEWNLDGTAARMVGVVQDITERKRLETLKDEFISSVSHELRTPLTSIKGALDLVIEESAGLFPENIARILTIAHENSERLFVLINDLLDIEKLHSGKVTLDITQLEVKDLIDKALSANQGYAEKYDVKYMCQPGNDNKNINGLVIDGDESRLMQVLTNLLSNAVKYSPKGGVVQVSSSINNNMLRISVKDSGPGIPDEFQDHIFERFAQADTSDSRQRGGTGLGLAISKEIVERHGGYIGFSTNPGRGSSFYFDLPIATESTSRA